MFLTIDTTPLVDVCVLSLFQQEKRTSLSRKCGQVEMDYDSLLVEHNRLLEHLKLSKVCLACEDLLLYVYFLILTG